LYRVVVPEAVASELLARPRSPGGEIPNQPWVERLEPTARSLRHVRAQPPPVDLDDRRARRRASGTGLRITGTLGILVIMHRSGLATQNLPSDVELLERTGMRISPALRQDILDRQM
jgi:hypothetical protein